MNQAICVTGRYNGVVVRVATAEPPTITTHININIYFSDFAELRLPTVPFQTAFSLQAGHVRAYPSANLVHVFTAVSTTKSISGKHPKTSNQYPSESSAPVKSF